MLCTENEFCLIPSSYNAVKECVTPVPYSYCPCLPNTAEQCTPCYQRCNRSQFLRLTLIKRHHCPTPLSRAAL